MVVVIFEVWLKPSEAQRYFDLAAALKAELREVEGFIAVERFQSLVEPNKYVSLSTWRDSKAVEDWYAVAKHKAAQVEGRASIFDDYRIRVADVFRDYDMALGREAVLARTP